jgi:peptidoglycan/LPS O-acetylase OafA/YrhL
MDAVTSGKHWRLGHRPALDGLRALAILLVVTSHLLPDEAYGSGGPAGVTVFFVLSGFLITSLLLEEHDRTGRVSLSGFYTRRARRLLPALAAVLCFVAVLYVAYGEPLRRLIPVVFYVANWPRAEGQNIPLLGHTWSLAIEEQFYIIWPLVLIFGLRAGRRTLLWLALTGAAASVALRFLLWDGAGRQDRVWFGTDTNAYSLLIGCALALWMSARITRTNRPRIAVLTAGVLTLSGVYSNTVGYTLVVPLAAATATVVLVTLLCQDGSAGIFGAPLLRYIGRRSYAYYLWHVPLLLILDTAGVDPVIAAGVTIVTTAALSELSWRVIEAPLLVGRQKRSTEARVAATQRA